MGPSLGVGAVPARSILATHGVCQRAPRHRDVGVVAAESGDLMSNVGDLMPILHDILTDVKRLTSGPITQAAENANKLIADNSVIPKISAASPDSNPDIPS